MVEKQVEDRVEVIEYVGGFGTLAQEVRLLELFVDEHERPECVGLLPARVDGGVERDIDKLHRTRKSIPTEAWA